MSTIVIGGKPRKIHGWKPEPLERRDPRDRFHTPKPRAFAPEFDIDLSMLYVFDQLDVGSCVANAICLAAAFVVWKANGTIVRFARLFLYALGRIFEKTSLDDDSGLLIPDGFKTLRKNGVCYEDTWPYGRGHDRFSIPPTQEAMNEALEHQGLFFYRCPSMTSVKDALEQGWPVVFGTAVASDLQDDGEFRLPAKGVGFDGGHCMLIKGWSDNKVMKDGTVGAYKVRNSWDTTWHAEDCAPGEGWVSYALFERGFATDCIALTGIEIPEAA